MRRCCLPSFINPPKPLDKQHCLDAFFSKEAVLDNWLKKHALKNHESGALRTFMVSFGDKIAAFMSLTVGSISHAKATGAMRRNMPDPDPDPVMILMRLAVDHDFSGYL